MGNRKGRGEETHRDLKIIKERLGRVLSYLDGEAIDKATKYERLKALLDCLSFEVSSISKTHDERGNTILIVNYGRPHSKILVSPDGQDVIWEPMATAMNELNLIGYEDMERIADAIYGSIET